MKTVSDEAKLRAAITMARGQRNKSCLCFPDPSRAIAIAIACRIPPRESYCEMEKLMIRGRESMALL